MRTQIVYIILIACFCLWITLWAISDTYQDKGKEMRVPVCVCARARVLCVRLPRCCAPCVYDGACVRAYVVRMCVHACVRACVRVRAPVCVRVRACAGPNAAHPQTRALSSCDTRAGHARRAVGLTAGP